MNADRINLKNTNKITLNKQRNKKYNNWVTRLSVPKDAELIMCKIQLSRLQMGMKSVARSSEWYVALQIYELVLCMIDYDYDYANENTDMFTLIKMNIENKLLR